MLVEPGVEIGPHSFLALATASSIVAGLSAAALRGPARRLGLVSRRRRERFSTREVALAGGPGLALGMAVPLALLGAPWGAGGAIAATGFFAAGLLDDFVELRAPAKLALQSGVALLSSLALLPPEYVALGVLGFLVLVNASNYLDNMDGLLPGVALAQAAALAHFGLVAPAGSPLLLWALPGVLLLNLPPARVFLGDSGSHLVGALLALDAIELLFDPELRPGRVVPLALVFAVPLADLAVVTISRLRRRRPVLRGGTDHLSHRLVRLGWPPGGAVALLVLASAVCGAAGLLLAHSS